MSSFEVYFTSSEDEDHCDMRDFRRRLRDKSNPLELPYNLFVRYFRINKDDFKFLLTKLDSRLQNSTRISSISPIVKLSATLRYFAEGGYQTGCGNEHLSGLAQSTFSKVLTQVLNIIEDEICAEFIKFPTTNAEKDRIKLAFYTKNGIPGVIGCVDGTHFKIASPSKENRHLYLNRKGFYSLNAMLVCNDRMYITFADANYPGSCHDSFIYNASELDTHMQSNYNDGNLNTWLLGDAGYGLKPYLITPFRTTADESQERVFNKKHSKARNIIERTIGLLKNRYRCLLDKMHYKPEKAAQIAHVCCALHNMCIVHNVDLDLDTTIIPPEIEQPTEFVEEENIDAAQRIRMQLMNSVC